MNQDNKTPDTPAPAPEMFPPQSMPSQQKKSMKKPLLLAAMGLVLLVVVSAVALTLTNKQESSNTGGATGEEIKSVVAVIEITNEGFSPDSLKVAPNTTVEFKNTSSSQQIINGDELGAGNTIAPGATFTYLYQQPGDYEFSTSAGSGKVTVRE